MNWLKKTWKTILIIILAITILYFVFPKYDFLAENDTLYKCNKITGECNNAFPHSGSGAAGF